MSKIEGWENRLNATVSAALHRPFVWGQHDCSLFAARCADAVWGTSIESKHEGRYKTIRGAHGRISRLGGCAGILTREGFHEINPAFTQRGDIVVLDQEGREAMGVSIGGKIAAVSHDGLTFLPMALALGVWRK